MENSNILPFAQASLVSLRQLGYLVAVADTLNFTQAAARCFVTQSTLSGGIQELERLLDANLVDRDRRGVHITPLGKEVVTRARALLSSSADLVHMIKRHSQPLTGPIHLGVIPTIAPFMLTPLVAALKKRAPGLELVPHEKQTDELVDGVEGGSLDGALIALPMEVGRLNVQILFPEDMWLIAEAKDPLLKLKSINLSQVESLRPLILLSEGHCLREHTLQACQTMGRRGRVPQTNWMEAQSLPTLVEMVCSGLGVALLPTMCIKPAGRMKPHLKCRRLSPTPQRTIALVSRKSSRSPEVFDLLAGFIKKVYQQLPQPQ